MVTQPTSSSDPIRVLFLSAEAYPFIKVGGLGDVGGALPVALHNLLPAEANGRQIDIRLVIPFHGAIDQSAFSIRSLTPVTVATEHGNITASVSATELSGIPVYLIGGDPITKSPGVYSLNPEEDGIKFAFFSLAALELARQLNFQPEILHANDWHTALSIYTQAQQKASLSFFENTKTVITLHNLPFVGAGAEAALHEFNLPVSKDQDLPEWARQLPLPLALQTADEIVAVSPTYAQEILTPEFGCGLQKYLQLRAGSITGILNGIDTQIWDPTRETGQVTGYSADSLNLRRVNKQALQNRFSFQEDEGVPLLIFIGRMDPQKGIDLVIRGLQLLSELNWQAIILGTGIPALEAEARQLEIDFPDRVRSVMRFDSRLSHLMYAGADILMMPSRYEPCGLAQMIAMRYGCIPVARSTGGLKDTIRDASKTPESTGFLFESITPKAFAGTLQNAMYTFQNKPGWQAMQTRSMAQDFSWKRSAQSYADLYQQLTKT